jgi:hypothetical protein
MYRKAIVWGNYKFDKDTVDLFILLWGSSCGLPGPLASSNLYFPTFPLSHFVVMCWFILVMESYRKFTRAGIQCLNRPFSVL